MILPPLTDLANTVPLKWPSLETASNDELANLLSQIAEASVEEYSELRVKELSNGSRNSTSPLLRGVGDCALDRDSVAVSGNEILMPLW